MAISFKDKIAYVNKFADKADEKLQKVIKLSVNIESPKLNLTDAQKDKIKSSLQTAFDRIKKIEDEKTGTGKKPRQPNLMALTKQIQTKQGITFEQARTKAKQAFAAKKSGQTNAIQAVLQDFKSKVGKLAYSRATKGTDIKRDMERPALKEGKRKVTTQGYTTNKYGTFKNKVGSVYYENRANRIDINQPSKKRYPKLENGGEFGGGGGVGSFPFMTFEDGQEAMRKVNNGELPKHFSYVEKEKTLYYLPNVTAEWVQLKSFATKQKAIEWVKSSLKSEGFANGGEFGGGGGGGMTMQAIAKKYEKNEDENAHSENVVLLAKHFGTAEELKEAKAILKKHNEEGSLSSENGAKRRELSLRLIEKARAEMKKEGVQFAKGGRTATNYMGKKSKETLGKHDLSKMYDNNLDLIADVVDYIQDLRKDVGESYARDFVYELMEVLKEGKITYNDGATLKFRDGGAIKGSNPSTGEKFGVVVGSLEKEDGRTTLIVRSGYSSRIKSYELRFDEKGFLSAIGDFGSSTDGTFPDMNKGRLSVSNVGADNKKESVEAISKITSPSFAKKVYDYVQEEKMAKGGLTEHGLKKGDTITDDMFWEDTIVVKNEKSGTRAKVNLNTGERKEAKMANGGYVAVGEKDGYWTIISKPSTKENAQKMLDLGSLPRGEMGKVVTVEEAKAHKKVIGREYLAYGGKMKYSRKK